MLLDYLVGGTMSTNPETKVNELVEIMAHNEYRSLINWGGKRKGKLELEKYIIHY